MPTETEVLPGSASPQLNNDLPESAQLKADAPGIDNFFKSDEPAKDSSVPEQTTHPETREEIVEVSTGIAARLAAKGKPVAASVAPAASLAVPADPVEAIEIQMRAANKNWKPSDGWTKLKEIGATERTARLKLETDLAEVQKKLTTIPASGSFVPEEVERLKAEHKAFSDELAVTRLEAHPDFRRQFIEPKQAELTRARDLLEAHNIKGAAVERLLALPRAELGKAVAEMVKDIPAFDQVEVSDALRKAYALEQGGQQALARSKDVLKQMQQNSAARARQAFESKWAPVAAGFKEHTVEMEIPANATPQQRQRAEQFNSAIQSLRSKAEQNAFAPHDEGGIAELAMKAAAYDLHVGVVQPQLLSEMDTILKSYGKLAEELKAIKSRNPNKGIHAPAARSDDGTHDPTQMNHKDAAEHFFNPRTT